VVAAAVSEAWRTQFDLEFEARLAPEEGTPSSLAAAVRYATLGGGKRIRPLVCMGSAAAAGADPGRALPAACAVEFVHCFSLVHDDLPAIDDDDIRRGRPTVHRQFDEATAVLAGDALFALGFACLADPRLTAAQSQECLRLLSTAVGGAGLVGGEVLDVEAKERGSDVAHVRRIHSMKTGALFSAACSMGAVCAGGSEETVGVLGQFGAQVGLAFQIADDCLDATSTVDDLGKPVGTDADKGRATYPAAIGLEGARAEAVRLVEAAVASLDRLPGDVGPLCRLAQSCIHRAR
jgi:geranylgeranyl diphosphate synthase type II